MLQQDTNKQLEIFYSRPQVKQMLKHLGPKKNEVDGAAGTRENSPDADADYICTNRSKSGVSRST